MRFRYSKGSTIQIGDNQRRTSLLRWYRSTQRDLEMLNPEFLILPQKVNLLRITLQLRISVAKANYIKRTQDITNLISKRFHSKRSRVLSTRIRQVLERSKLNLCSLNLHKTSHKQSQKVKNSKSKLMRTKGTRRMIRDLNLRKKQPKRFKLMLFHQQEDKTFRIRSRNS